MYKPVAEILGSLSEQIDDKTKKGGLYFIPNIRQFIQIFKEDRSHVILINSLNQNVELINQQIINIRPVILYSKSDTILRSQYKLLFK